MTEWNATLYDRQHDFVAEYGKELLTFVPQQPKQAILDLGCGTGTLTAQLNSLGDDVKGTDRSPAMIAQARRSYPTIQFEVEDGLQMTDVNRWDVIFSNAVFHWIQDHPRLLRRIYQALRPGANSFVSLVRPVISQRSKMGFVRPLRHMAARITPNSTLRRSTS